MNLREGQERVEIRPGVFIWMNEADAKRFHERQAQPPVESAAVAPPEAAVVDMPRARVVASPPAAKPKGKS